MEAALTLEAHGVRLTATDMGGGTEALFTAARGAFEALDPSSPSSSPPPLPTYGGGDGDRGRSPTEKALRAARRLLADGRVHERREIAKAVRDAGVAQRTVNQLSALLDRHFEKGKNVDGRPTYRDPSVPSGYATPPPVPDDEKPAWMRPHPPTHDPGDEELLAANGATGK